MSYSTGVHYLTNSSNSILQHLNPQAFAPANRPVFGVSNTKLGVTIADGVEFDTVAREWRCKWSPDDDKASLVAAQKALEEVVADIKGVEGVKDVSRVVCGGCLDFKVRDVVVYDCLSF